MSLLCAGTRHGPKILAVAETEGGSLPPSDLRAPAGSVLAVSVEPLVEGFLRVSFSWLIRALAAVWGGFESELSASLRVRRRSDDQIVYEQSFRAGYSGALLAKETIEADLQRLTVAEFLSEYSIPGSGILSNG